MPLARLFSSSLAQFATMLEHLTAIAANRIQLAGSLPALTVIITPTPIQR